MLHDVAQHHILIGEGNTVLQAKHATRFNNTSVLAFDRYFQ